VGNPRPQSFSVICASSSVIRGGRPGLYCWLDIQHVILTLGLFLIVINAAMLKFAAAIVKGFDITGVRPALLGGVLLSLLNLGVSAVFGIS
jgi:putative membrane protein